MNNTKRSAQPLNTVLNILFWLLIARGVFAVGYHCMKLYALFTDPAALSAESGLRIDWLTIKTAESYGLDRDGAISMRLVYLISAAAITAVACLGIRALKRVLLPVVNGQPFRSGISAGIVDLGKCAFRLGMVENLSMLAIVILMERHAVLDALLRNDTAISISIDPALRPTWFIAAGVLAILAGVFRRGEALQTLSDETL